MLAWIKGYTDQWKEYKIQKLIQTFIATEFSKGAMNTRWRKNILSLKWCWENGIQRQTTDRQTSTQNRSWIQTTWGPSQKPEGSRRKRSGNTSRHWQRQCFGENLQCADNNSKNRQMGLCHSPKLWMAKETISWVKGEPAEWRSVS